MRNTDKSREVPLAAMVHTFVGTGGGDLATLVILPERQTGAVECAMRGAELHLVQVIEKALKAWGLSRVVLFLGQEPAMVALGTAGQQQRDGETIPYCRTDQSTISKLKNHAVNTDLTVRGSHENTNAIGGTRAASVDCAIRRFIIRSNGTTAFRRLRGREYGGSIVAIGKTVLDRKQGWVGSKLAPRLDRVTWLGDVSRSVEHILGTPEGRITATSVMRSPESKRWSGKLIERIVCSPWGPTQSSAPRLPRREITLRHTRDAGAAWSNRMSSVQWSTRSQTHERVQRSHGEPCE